MIRDHFGDNYRGMSLQYSVETEPLGTGGAIRQAMELSGADEVLVLNGDTLFRVELEKFLESHHKRGGILSVAVKHVADTDRFGRVEVSEDDVITDFLEKAAGGPGWINGGVYIVSKSLFGSYSMPERFSFEQDLVEPNIGTIRPLAFCSGAYFIDMGIPEDYERACREIGS
jgi:D-glycero-alpha-D-manno-heptose 1-phosphate guanylyltransferase